MHSGLVAQHGLERSADNRKVESPNLSRPTLVSLGENLGGGGRPVLAENSSNRTDSLFLFVQETSSEATEEE